MRGGVGLWHGVHWVCNGGWRGSIAWGWAGMQCRLERVCHRGLGGDAVPLGAGLSHGAGQVRNGGCSESVGGAG